MFDCSIPLTAPGHPLRQPLHNGGRLRLISIAACVCCCSLVRVGAAAAALCRCWVYLLPMLLDCCIEGHLAVAPLPSLQPTALESGTSLYGNAAAALHAAASAGLRSSPVLCCLRSWQPRSSHLQPLQEPSLAVFEGCRLTTCSRQQRLVNGVTTDNPAAAVLLLLNS